MYSESSTAFGVEAGYFKIGQFMAIGNENTDSQPVHHFEIEEPEEEVGLLSSSTEVDEQLDPDFGEEAKQKVLFVDDEAHILKAVRRLFSGRNYTVLTAESGEEALEILDDEPISVLVSDQRMPGISGTELLDHARRHKPKTVRLMLTGNNDVSTAMDAINEGAVFRFVTKPWDHDDFLQTVELALEQHELRISKERYERHIQAQNVELQRLNTKLRQFNEELEQRVEERTVEVVTQQREVARLYEELQHSFDGMIKALLCIMELGDTHVIEHCQRTAERVRAFGEFLELDAEMLHELERAALLHWIGLINASPSLFSRPVEEFDAVDSATWEFHPLLGQQALRHVPALNRAGQFILYYLHRYDDREFQPGVPLSEASDEVLTEEFIRGCQVLRICSTFEQVKTSNQSRQQTPSKWPKLVDEGLKVLTAGSDTKFDPELVSQFRELMERELDSSKSREITVSFEELQPGMVLARPLETVQGIPVAPRDMIITEELIERLQRFRDSSGLEEIHIWA